MARRFLIILAIFLPALSAHADGEPALATKHMVATANPLATEAGLEILRKGGSAVDATIAIQMVLTLVEPQSSGIGGGAFLMHYGAGDGAIQAFDGRETAPAVVDSTLFLGADGKPENKGDVMPGGRSAGAPGVIRMLALAHEQHGKLPWADLFGPAIRLARDGFAISPRLHYMIDRDSHLKKFPETEAYFFTTDGKPLPVGHRLKNPALAETLETLAAEGPNAFYEGAIAEDIAAAVQNAIINPGTLTAGDIAAYQPKERDPVCGTYRAWKICGMSPPSSGGVAVFQILKILEGFDLAEVTPETAEAANLFSEAARLAYADRATWLGDSDFVDVPVAGLTDPGYLSERRALIEPGRIMADSPAGTPPGVKSAYRTATPSEVPATTHYSVVDQWGNVVAMTSSVENAFGNRMMVRGFFLNNQLTDFSFAPEDEKGAPAANRVEGSKRPLSSMSPTLVFDSEGRPVMTLGSPGGPLIISFVAKTLIGVLDWNMSMQDAINLSNLIYFNGSMIVERDSALMDARAQLEAMGYGVREGSLASGLHGIVIHYEEDGATWLEGGADPRREGTAEGD